MSTIARTKAIGGLFTNRASAEFAYQGLLDFGYTAGEIDLIMSEQTREGEESGSPEPRRNVSEGITVGGTAGAIAGGIAAALAAVGTSLVIPGLGLVIAGPIAGALAGAGTGAVAGSLIGTLVELGMPDDTARDYETAVREGGVIVGVTPHHESEVPVLERMLRDHGATRIDRY